MKKKIVVTGGAGFVGSNLIKYLLNKTNYKIISIDNYSSGSKNNHIKNSKVKYLRSNTKNISKILNKKKISVTKLARGVPVGSDLEYVDEATLIRAIEGRISV